MPSVPSTQKRYYVYTDASYGSGIGGGTLTLRLSRVFTDQDTFDRASHTSDVPTSVMDEFSDPDTYIACGNAVVPLLCLLQHSAKLQGSPIVMLTDDMEALCSLDL